MPHHEVVQHPYVHQGQGVREASGEAPICVGGFGHPGRAVVDEYQCRRIVSQGRPHGRSRVHRSAIDGAAERLFDSDGPVPVIRL